MMNNRGGSVNVPKFETKPPVKFEPRTPGQSPVRGPSTNPVAAASANAPAPKPNQGNSGDVGKSEPNAAKGLQQNRGNRFSNAPNDRGPGGPDASQSGSQVTGNMRRDQRPVQSTEASKESEPPASESSNTNEESESQSLHKEKKFSGRCRLFVGNLPNDMTEHDFRKLFEPFGDCSEVFVNSGRGFGFIRLDTRHHAEDARSAVDGKIVRGRPLRVRFAAHSAALRVRYLSTHISNELLAEAFSIFGEVERAVVCVDDRGKSTGEGIVEFARKPGATTALKRISEGVFLMSG